MDLNSDLNQFLFGYYPYICLAVFFVGSLIRFDREQYTWKSDSSQLLRRGQLWWGSNLFHVGVLGILAGHFTGFLTPIGVWHAIGISMPQKQMTAMVAGGLFGAMCTVGLGMLLARRLIDPRIRAVSSPMDVLILFLLLAQVVLGLGGIPISAQHPDGSEMLKFMRWAQRIATFRGGAAELVANVSIVFKLHIVLGLTLFLVFPFTRLVHVWSGFASVSYLLRPYQLMRRR
ncbi:MAG: respiratory nitrate reductase subunit gamma [Betaproteobacteria bacterium RIFCSPLOWO2_12_FULL_63_13]|nr:MAG: respiratory nitrate reductase subunit gamma [Betaproteobacteria bacterium RIFCSPLOWO2_02_FULL_63_19]OGA42765.1 MAG: respiratory nitrate reductase subunit gamma [Betaproteobacteria bacterium RIFCSPLOWO2_12_FULL_63_13]